MALAPAVAAPARATQPETENETTESTTPTPETVEEEVVDEVSQVESLDDDYMNLEEDEETDVPEHMRSEEEPAPTEEESSEEPAPAPTPESATEQEEPKSEPETPKEEPEAAQPQPEQPAPEEPQAQTAPTEQPLTPEEVTRQRVEWRANAEKQLAEGQFAVSDELVEEFEVEPGKAIPKLAAKVYLDAIEGATYAIVSQLPTLIQHMQQAQNIEAGYEGQFFDMWPQIDRKNQQHIDAVRQHVASFRQVNPQASPEDVMKHAGAATVLALKLPVGTTEAPAQPTNPPHRPVGDGGQANAPGQTQRSSNMFEQLDELVDEIEGEL